MYPNLKLSNLRISTKLLLLNLMTWAAFFLIVGVIVSSVAIVRNKLTAVANRDMGRVIANSQTTRKISKVFTDIDRLGRTFYGKKDYLASEGSRLVNTVNKISESTPDPDLKKSLLSLSDTLDSFLSRCAMVNKVLHAIESIDRETHDEITELENLIANLLVKLTLEGEDISFLEQILTLVVGYRESLLQISNLRLELAYESYFLPLEGKTSPLISIIDDLTLRLRTITASIPDVARHGKKIVNNVKKYREAVLTFYEEMEGLGLQLEGLKHNRVLSMSVMESIDDKISRATKLTINSIEKIILSSGTVVVLLSILVIISLGFASSYLIRSNIKNPIIAILKGLESFGKGNFDTQIELNRKDEWGTIEKAFNHMAADLLKSYTTLQQAHDELETRVEERTAELAETTEELKRELIVRKRTEETLRESEERLRQVIDLVPHFIFAKDRNGRFILVNQALAEAYGTTVEELIGKTDADFNPNKDEVEHFLRDDLQVMDCGQSKYILEEKITDSKGNIRILHTTKIPFTLSMTKDDAVLGISTDITKDKQAEEERRNMEAQLQQANKMEAIGTLAGGIAHDFNNLLMGIQGRTSLMKMDTSSSHPHSEHLIGIEDYVKSAADLTKQLLGFARGGKYEVKPTDLNELIRNQNRMFGRTRKEINILEKFEENLWPVESDKGQIEQMLLNIYVNAWYAMPRGGDLFIQTENIIIGEDYSKPYQVTPSRYVKISITDTGVGMDEATQQRIFEPFFTTKEMGRGTGLGLASAYGIIKNHKGFIDVYSEKGEGTKFDIYLPASEKKVIHKDDLAQDIFKGAETVLLVDDEDMVIDVGKPMLEKMGYTILIAKGGREAIESYKQNQDKIDMVILDMIMPEIGGGETYDRLKEINPDIKVLLASGYSITGQATEILERGCDGFIQKPFNMTDLSQKIRKVLNKD